MSAAQARGEDLPPLRCLPSEIDSVPALSSIAPTAISDELESTTTSWAAAAKVIEAKVIEAKTKPAATAASRTALDICIPRS